LARWHAVGRAEADALLRTLADRTTPLIADRRAHERARARDHRRADRLPQGSEAPRRHHPAGGAEFPRRAGDRRRGRRDGQRPCRARRHDGGARRGRAAPAPAAGAEPGYPPMSATETDVGAALPKVRADYLPLLLPLLLPL